MSKFVPLHITTGYSFLESGLTMKKIVKGITSNNYFGAGLTDINVMYGFPHFAHTMQELNKPYILGMDVTIQRNNLSLFVLNEQGYLNLLQINTRLQSEEITFDSLKGKTEGILCVLETNHGEFKERFAKIDELKTEFNRYLANLSSIFTSGFYLGIEVTSKEEVKVANSIRRFANEYTYQCVAFPRIKYLKKDDAIVLKIVQAIKEGEKQLSQKKAEGQEYFMSEEAYSKIYTKQEIENTINIVNMNAFDINLKRGEMIHYSKDNSENELREKCFESLKALSLDKNEKYIKQLEHELDVICSMGYADYFLLVQDYVVWAKENDVLVGPGRGSAAGSLVSYLLHITEVDPLEYNLLFERFLNPNRKTMPDIDVDFMDIKRDLVVQHMREKYGYNNVANIITFQTIQAKQAIRDIGRIYSKDYKEHHINMLCKAVSNPDFTLGQAYKNLPEFKNLVDSDKYFKEIISLAGKIEGLPRQPGVHPAGVVLNAKPMPDVLPVTIDFNDNCTSQYKAEYLEEQGFLKMDFLGLRNLTIVDLCVDLINFNHPETKISKTNIPFDSKEIFDLISSGQTMGLFQIDTPVMQRGIKTLKPSCFEDVVALLALNRPGPMMFIKNYADRRDGKEKYTFISDGLKDILTPTYGIIIYQEQIIQIATIMAGFSLGEADIFRRAISKKDKDKMVAYEKQFIEGSIKNGYTEKTAKDVFNLILKFADYGFNRSHSVVYAVLACRMAWLKAHYPLEFYSAILATVSSSNDVKFTEYLDEMKKRGIKMLPPSVNKSMGHFIISEKSLVFPLSSISGVNDLLVNNIIEERKKGPFKDFFDFAVRMYPYKISETQMTKLVDAGAFDELYPSRASMLSSVKNSLQYAELNYSTDGQLTLGISPIAPPSMAQEIDDPLVNLDREFEVLGIMLSSNPLEYKADLIKSLGVTQISDVPPRGNCKICGIIKVKKTITTKKKSSMAYIKVYDTSGQIEVTVFPSTFETTNSILTKNNIVVIEGRYDGKGSDISFIASDIKLLEE